VEELCWQYYKTYGLAIRGLLLHHDVDPSTYNDEVDDSIPLETLLTRDDALAAMLSRLKTRKWAFTNAGKKHAERVLQILGVRDYFEGVTFCDYTEMNFPCKPEVRAYQRAMQQAGVMEHEKCFLVDDSASNVDTAETLGWSTVHVTEFPENSTAGRYQIRSVKDLPTIFPHLFL